MDVYEPREDSFFMVEFLEKKLKKFEINTAIDVGSGSGILAEVLSSMAKHVVASDISRDTVRLLKEKRKRGALPSNVSIVLGNLVDFIKEADIVVFNPPYLWRENGERYDITIHQNTPNGEDVLKKFAESLARLKMFCAAYLLISSHSVDEGLRATLNAHGMKWKLMERKRLFFEELKILEIKRDKNSESDKK